MDAEKEFKYIKSFFITVVSITGICVIILLGFSYKDSQSFREEQEKKSERLDKEITDRLSYLEQIIDKTESRGIREIDNIKNTTQLTAHNAAIEKINETFKNNNIEGIIEKSARVAVETQLDKIVEKKVSDTETRLDELSEADLNLNNDISE